MRALIVLLISAASVAPAAAQANGKVIFEGKGNCHVCHGKDARGTALAPSLADTVWINVAGERASVIALIEKGVAKPVEFPTPMPPMGGVTLSREEIEALADYVLSLAKKPGT